MWPIKKSKKIEDLAESIAYDKILSESKINDMVLLYDEANLILFEKPTKIKRRNKKI